MLSAGLAFAFGCDLNSGWAVPDVPAADAAADGGLPDAVAVEEVQPGIYALAGTDPELPEGDLKPLLDLIGSARFIGIGESVLTSGGYYAFKRRLLQTLILRGLRVIAMQTPRSAAQTVENYFKTCQGTARDALIGISPLYVDDNALELLKWICAFNEEHSEDRVHFFGFDGDQPDQDRAQIEAFFQITAPSDVADLMAKIATCRVNRLVDIDSQGNAKPYPESEFDSCVQGMDAVDAYVESHRAELVSETSESRTKLAQLASIGLRSWQFEVRYQNSEKAKGFHAHNTALYRIFVGVRDMSFANHTIAIWADNATLALNHPAIHGDQGEAGYPYAGATSFGTELAKELGELGLQYAPIALVGYEVGTNWPGVLQGNSELPSSGSIEERLHTLGKPFLAVNPLSSWLEPERDYIFRRGPRMVPSHQFRALVYLESSPPMKALYW